MPFIFILILSCFGPGLAHGGTVMDYLKNYNRPKETPYPKANPYNKSKEQLGKALFYDPRLSSSNWFSCSSCHKPTLNWEDGLRQGLGHQKSHPERSTPTLLDAAWGELMYWDGRAENLENLVLAELQSPYGMNQNLDALMQKLKRISGYKSAFSKAFPDKPLRPPLVAAAIATFVRSLRSSPAPFDQWVSGDGKVISESAQRGFLIFNEKGRCAQCHSSWRFSDNQFHDIGLDTDDLGRGKILEGVDRFQHAFKTPTLRNIEYRAPYMHNGSLKFLSNVIDFYDQGGQVKRPSKSPHIKPLELNFQEKSDLINFLKTLSSPIKPETLPVLPQ